jgi:hypothetical protein
MTAKEKALWEEAVRVLGQNAVTVEAPSAKRVPEVGLVGRLYRRGEGIERSLKRTGELA